jgi:hypothetical protein
MLVVNGIGYLRFGQGEADLFLNVASPSACLQIRDGLLQTRLRKLVLSKSQLYNAFVNHRPAYPERQLLRVAQFDAAPAQFEGLTDIRLLRVAGNVP